MARTKAEKFAYEYGSKARVEWVKAMPCCACGQRRGCDNAHTTTDGTGRKSHHRNIVPLCFDCHRVKLPSVGKLSFEQSHELTFDGEEYFATLADVAEAVHAEWTSNEEGLAL